MRPVLILVTLSVSFISALAQTAELTGRVTDQNGAAVAGADVTLDRQGQRLQTTTDDAGIFRFENINPIGGRIRVSANGFDTVDRDVTGSVMDLVMTVSPIVDTITVTRGETRLSDTPQSVFVLSGSDISNDPAPTLDDKLRQVPGFTLFRRSGSRTANPTSQGVSLRGTAGSGASRAAVTVDGFPLNDPFGGWVYWGRVPAESVRSVEILRGSAGELYGSSGIGGMIAVSTLRPGPRPVFSLDASLGSETTAVASMFSSVTRGRFGASIAAEAFRTDGVIAVAESQRGLIDTPSGVSRFGAVPYLDLAISKNARAFFSFEYFGERRGNGTPLQTNDTRTVGPRAGLDVTGSKFGGLALRAWFVSQRYHQSFSSVAGDRNAETVTRLQAVPSRSAGAGLQWSRPFSKGSVFAGGEYRNVSGSSDEIAFIAGRPTAFVNSGGRESTTGSYIGGTFFPVERLVLSAGSRIDHWREYSAYTDTRPIDSLSVTRAIFADRTHTAVSPRASALVRVSDGFSITANIARGFRQPTLNELYRSFRVGNVLTLSNEDLRAERSTTAEAGVLASSFGRRLYVRAVAFCTTIDQPVANVTLTVTPSLITRQRQNLGSTRSCGAETDVNARVSARLELSAGYLFADARVRSFPADRSLEGLRVPQVARHQFTFQARYTDPRLVTASLRLRAASSQFDDDQNVFRLGGFAVFDVFLSRPITKNLDLYVTAENIFDSVVEAGRTPILTLTAPPTVRAGVRIRFGRAR